MKQRWSEESKPDWIHWNQISTFKETKSTKQADPNSPGFGADAGIELPSTHKSDLEVENLQLKECVFCEMQLVAHMQV